MSTVRFAVLDGYVTMISMSKKLFTPIFFILNIMNFLILTANNLFVLYPLHLRDIGKTTSEIGFIMGVFFISGMFSRFFIGGYLDRIGRRFFVRLGLCMFMLAAILYAIPVNNTYYLYFVRLLHGAACGFYFTALFTWIADYAPEGHLAEAIGIFGVSGLLTNASGPLVGEYILRVFNNNFTALFIFVFVVWGVGLAITSSMNELHKPVEEDEMEDSFELLKRADVLIVCFTGVVFGVGMAAVFTFIAPFFKEYQMGDVSSFMVPYTTAAILVRLLFGRLADKSRNALLIPGFIVMAAGQFLLGKANTMHILPYIGCFLGISHGLIYPAMVALTLDRVGPANKGKGMGIINASNDVGNLAGASILGVIAEHCHFAKMYQLSGFIVAIGLAIYLSARRSFNKKLQKKNR